MKDKEILEEALEHEERAVRLYREWAEQADNDALQEMLEQFAMNESWHAAAVRAKLDVLRIDQNNRQSNLDR